MLVHYVQFDTPGAVLPESPTRKVNSRLPSRLRKIPEGTYAFCFFDREEVQDGRDTLVGPSKNKSVRVLFGVVRTLKDLEELGYSEKDHLYRNLKNNSFPHLVYCIMGNWQPAKNSDIILEDYKSLKTLGDREL